MELVAFADDGTAVVHLISRDVTLRRPTLRQYRELRETLEAAQEKAQPQADALSVAAIALNNTPTDDRTSEATLAFAAQVRYDTITVRNLGEEIRVMWLMDVMRTLSDAVVSEDELPPEVLDGPWPSELIDHWRSRPTRPGV